MRKSGAERPSRRAGQKTGTARSAPTPNDGVHFTSRVRMCVIAVDDGFNSYRN